MFRLGDTFERFEITELLGMGFMGEVYEVAHRHQDRRYAIKFLRLAHRSDVDKVERSLAEAEVMLRMDHANIVRVHDAGVTTDGTVWMRMDRLYGKTLRELIGRTRLSPISALHLVEEIAWGLDHAHELSVIHRDVKPENVFVTTEPRVVLLDLGLAKFIPHELEKTGPLRLLGTMAYAAPERIVGATLIDGRVDIYSLGVVLFEMLAGAHPFADVLTDPEALGHAHLTREPQGLTELGLPEYVLSLVRKLMAKDPDGRHFTASDCAKALRAARQRLVDDAQEGRYIDEGLRLEGVASPMRRGYVAPAPAQEGSMASATVAPATAARAKWRLLGVAGVLLGAAVMIGGAWLRGLLLPAATPVAATSGTTASSVTMSSTLLMSPAPIAPLPSARAESTTSAPATSSRSTSTATAPRRRPRAPLPSATSSRPKLPF
jgi:serine/threonine-protein kinase